jgi:hypothetical protein
MSAMGLGRVKTSALAPHVEISLSNCISESQIIPHTRGSLPCWRIVFSTFRKCMSFYTARVIRGREGRNPHARACPLRAESGRVLSFCHGHVGFDRVGNETILVCSVVHFIEFFRTGSSVPAPRDLRA